MCVCVCVCDVCVRVCVMCVCVCASVSIRCACVGNIMRFVPFKGDADGSRSTARVRRFVFVVSSVFVGRAIVAAWPRPGPARPDEVVGKASRKNDCTPAGV